jgi:hypothetical protein
MKTLFACWLTAIAVLVWLAIPAPSSFEKRWPIALPSDVAADVRGRAQSRRAAGGATGVQRASGKRSILIPLALVGCIFDGMSCGGARR